MVAGEATTFQRGRCAKAPDTTRWVEAVKALFDTVRVDEGLVYDAFDLTNQEKIILLRDQAGRNWLWLNQGRQIVYAQRWHAD